MALSTVELSFIKDCDSLVAHSGKRGVKIEIENKNLDLATQIRQEGIEVFVHGEGSNMECKLKSFSITESILKLHFIDSVSGKGRKYRIVLQAKNGSKKWEIGPFKVIYNSFFNKFLSKIYIYEDVCCIAEMVYDGCSYTADEVRVLKTEHSNKRKQEGSSKHNKSKRGKKNDQLNPCNTITQEIPLSPLPIDSGFESGMSAPLLSSAYSTTLTTSPIYLEQTVPIDFPEAAFLISTTEEILPTYRGSLLEDEVVDFLDVPIITAPPFSFSPYYTLPALYDFQTACSDTILESVLDGDQLHL